MIEEDQRNNQEVIVRSHQLVKQDKNFCNLMNRDWADAQARDPVIRHVIDWIERLRNDKQTLGEFLKDRVPEIDRRAYVAREKQFKVIDKLLYLRVTTPGGTETLLVFVVPARKRLAAIDGCHRCAGHQGRDRTLSLMKERFWWPGMSKTLLMVTSNCGHCKQFEAKGDLPGMQPIICYGAHGASPHRLCGHGSHRSCKRKADREEHTRGSGSLHSVCSGVCHP